MRAGRAKADAARAAASAASAAFAIAFSDASTAASLALLAAGSGSVADKVAAETAEAAAALSAAAFADSSGSGTASAAAAAFSATSGFSSAAFSSVSTAGFTTPTTPTAEPYPSDMYQDAFGAHTSKTIELNRVANIVARTMLFGGKREKRSVADKLTGFAGDFSTRWEPAGAPGGSQEVRFVGVLAVLLRENLQAAEAASANTGLGDLNALYGGMNGGAAGVAAPRGKSILSSALRATAEAVITPTEYRELKEAREAGKAQALVMAGVRAEAQARVAASAGGAPALRLFETYQNAFQRVVEVGMGAKEGDNDMLNREILQSFLTWEQSLRRSLTKDLWTQNPAELVGTWDLIDVPGNGDLQQAMTLPSSSFVRRQIALLQRGAQTAVEFTREGRVQVSPSGNQGLKWFFRPGPAHLDTCEFFVRGGTPDLLLHFVGSIDRGQRIESRFSARPIRMSGRVLSIVKGEAKGNSRFVMELQRKSN